MKLNIGILGYMTRSVGIAIGDDGTPPRCVQLNNGIDWRSWGQAVYIVPQEIIGKLLPLYTNGSVNQHLKTVTTAVTGYDYRFFGNRFSHILSSHGDPLSKFHLSNLSEAAHKGAFVDEEGVLIRCGHGSSIYTRFGGHRIITGGWSTVGGDDGSGIWLGHQALFCITSLHDKSASQPQAALATEILRRLGIKNPVFLADAPTLLEDLFIKREINGELAWKQRLYEIGLEVIDIAASNSDGRPAALEIIDYGHRQLIGLIHGGLNSANATAKSEFKVCLGGSIFGNSWYVARFKEHLRNFFPHVNIVRPLYSPIMGIALLAIENSKTATPQELDSFLTSWGNEDWAKAIIRG